MSLSLCHLCDREPEKRGGRRCHDCGTGKLIRPDGHFDQEGRPRRAHWRQITPRRRQIVRQAQGEFTLEGILG